MSILAEIEADIVDAFTTTEAFVINVITKIKQGAEVILSHLQAALTWIAGHAGDITGFIQQILGVAQMVSFVDPAAKAAVTAAVAGANVAMSALNAFANSYTAAHATVTDAAQAVLNGYKALQGAKAAAATMASVVVSAPTAAVALAA